MIDVLPLQRASGPENFDVKLQFLAKQLAWIVIFIIMLPLCLWGIYVGAQFRNDKCVKSSTFSIDLDYWLIFACSYDLLFAFIVLGMLCYRASSRTRRMTVFFLHLVNLFWMGAGICLIVESHLRCPHNILWVMSVIMVSGTLATIALILTVGICNCMGACHRLGRYLSFEETPYDGLWDV